MPKIAGAPYELVKGIKELGSASGGEFRGRRYRHPGRCRPDDADRSGRHLCEVPVFLKAANPAVRAKAIVEATTHFNDPQILAKVSENLGEPMVGISASSLPEAEQLATRGW